MSQTENTEVVTKKSGMTKWIVIAAVIAFLGGAFKFLLPKGYSNDLSLIGKGKAVMVLVRDNQTVQSHDLMEVMDNLRDQYQGTIEFLLTDYNTPQGTAFIKQNEASRVSLVLFNAQGNRTKVLHAPQDAGSLADELDALLDAQP